ncbi:unnamed protein product [Rangifer tarandus platyrhynchus]|uniref:Uncharacterized protein n=1 Tax=Rangifer tarandus platyrhynchus TaxID=3082113 RepID=A0AC59YAA2_RANTA
MEAPDARVPFGNSDMIVDFNVGDVVLKRSLSFICHQVTPHPHAPRCPFLLTPPSPPLLPVTSFLVSFTCPPPPPISTLSATFPPTLAHLAPPPATGPAQAPGHAPGHRPPPPRSRGRRTPSLLRRSRGHVTRSNMAAPWGRGVAS